MTSPGLPGSSSSACMDPDDASDSTDWIPASSRKRRPSFSPAHLSAPSQPRSRQPPAPSPTNSSPPAPCRYPDDQVVIFSPISNASFTHSSPASRARALDDLVKGILEARLLRSGQLVVTVSSPALADVLLSVKNLNGVPVAARYLSSRTGVIMVVPLCVSDEDLADALSSTASSFTRLLRRDPSGSWIPLTSVKAQFNSSVPSSVAISYHVFHVRPFIPNPIQCRNCQRYGHSMHNCRSPVRCGRCAGPHSSSDCSSSSPRVCAHCKGPHLVWDRGCPHRRRAREIERLRVVLRLTLHEALRRVPLPSTPSDKLLAPAPSLDSSTQTSPVIYSDADSNTDLSNFSDSECQASPSYADAATTTRSPGTYTVFAGVRAKHVSFSDGSSIVIFSPSALQNFFSAYFDASITLARMESAIRDHFFTSSDEEDEADD